MSDPSKPYEVSYRYYQYNSGQADNGMYDRIRSFALEAEAVDLASRINASKAGKLNDEDEERLKEELIPYGGTFEWAKVDRVVSPEDRIPVLAVGVTRVSYRVMSPGGAIHGTACQAPGGWRFVPNTSARKISRRVWPSAEASVPDWARKALAGGATWVRVDGAPKASAEADREPETAFRP